MASPRVNSYFGKYREIVIAVACFLVFDLAVLVLNFYISFQISEDAVAINLAGRQRMLSQRMTKEILTVEQSYHQGMDTSQPLDDLNKTTRLFQTTLTAFRQGGMTTGSNGLPVHLNQVTSNEASEVLLTTLRIWTPLQNLLKPLLEHQLSDSNVSAAVEYAKLNNLALLKLMNDLTTRLEQNANRKANMLRKVQTIGIFLALINFAFILFKFIVRLREGDRKIELAQDETQEILDTVREGLLLVGQDYRIGTQYSASLAEILGRKIIPGTDFREILKELLPDADYKAGCNYIELLLGDRVKENLVQDLNPMTKVKATIKDKFGASHARYLNLKFNRAFKEGEIAHLLVTVQDVTQQIELKEALADAQKKAKAEIEVMVDLLKINPTTLNQFLRKAEVTLLEINDHLKDVSGPQDYRRVISLIFRKVHDLKSEAAMLGLEMFEELAHDFELKLAQLRDKGAVSGNDILSVPFPLDEFLQRITSVRDLSQRLASYQNAFPTHKSSMELSQNLFELVQRIAEDLGKQVKLSTDLTLLESLPSNIQMDIQYITLQLIRNAVVHGIEDMATRAELLKPDVGNIHVGLNRVDGEYELILHDDGRGLIPARIREYLINKGLYTSEQLKDLSDNQIVMKIFEPGFSTADEVSKDAGHGVGMDIVKQKIKDLGARLRIATRKDNYTKFCIRFAV
ncbi:MAG: type IV pili methyl-accepting chemotaxis transducer N-terminal domain-containing protein [Pseudomonadales bacterium]|nr:type IV pili methyl-accepting chemotaxis transducer N-terminal domain-containing protein [Pseudomonadales bacterium]